MGEYAASKYLSFVLYQIVLQYMKIPADTVGDSRCMYGTRLVDVAVNTFDHLRTHSTTLMAVYFNRYSTMDMSDVQWNIKCCLAVVVESWEFSKYQNCLLKQSHPAPADFLSSG